MAERTIVPAEHDIRFCGLTGVIFVSLTAALVLFLEGFVTTSWSVEAEKHEGLWQTCASQGFPMKSDWLISTQVFASLSLVFVVLCFGLISIYITLNKASKNVTIVFLAALSFISGLFIIVSVAVYGTYASSNSKLSWSYYLALVAGILCVIAGILAVRQAQRSNVQSLRVFVRHEMK